MVRTTRARMFLLALCLFGAAVWAAPPLEARPQKGYIEFSARLEPHDLGPGQTGTLVVTSHAVGHHYTYATSGSSEFTWRPAPVKGVKYDVPAPELTWTSYKKKPGNVVWNEPAMHQDQDYPGLPPYPVWEEGHDLEIRVPVTLAADLAPDAFLGLEIDYSPCDHESCYQRVKNQKALVQLGKSPKPTAAEAKLAVGEPLGDATATVSLDIVESDGESTAIVTFAPSEGYHLYQPGAEGSGIPISVEPQEDAGITWGDWFFDEEGGEFHEPYSVALPFTREVGAGDSGKKLRIFVSWQGCLTGSHCERPDEGMLVATWEAVAPAVPPTPMVQPGSATEPAAPAPAVPEVPDDGEKRMLPANDTVPFPQVWGDDLDTPRSDDDWVIVDESMSTVSETEEEGGLESRWAKSWILFLGAIFVFGVGLAFTPCVLPIIPLTISVIGGGSGDISRSRLTLLLTVYVLGLSLTYGAAGAASGALGEAIDITAAFRMPAVIWGIVALFLVLAAGMIGIYELQPPAWMERMRGGAQQKSGTIIGSFLLGILAALVASPCTGPFVVGMLTFVATRQDPLLGFILFFTLGLGMGSVFFAAGSLNLLVRPGVWMVWVRYAFGIILVGVALFFLANTGLVPTWALFALGFGIAFLVWMAVTRHLYRREGETLEKARMRGAILAVLVILTTIAVAALAHAPHIKQTGLMKLGAALVIGLGVGLTTWWLMSRGAHEDEDAKLTKRWEKDVPRLIGVISVVVIAVAAFGYFTRPAIHGPAGWIKLKDVAHLKKEIARATTEGRPVVVDVWATWCTYCKAYDRVIEDDPYLLKVFDEDLIRLKIDVEHDDHEDLRTALGIPFQTQPRMAFFDEKGRIRRAADVIKWYGGEATTELNKRVDFLLRRTGE